MTAVGPLSQATDSALDPVTKMIAIVILLTSATLGTMTYRQIDFLYRWVNPAHGLKKLEQALLEQPIAARGEMNCVNRYRDNNELKYSLRSVARHAPWVRAIHIICEGPPPEWLNMEGPVFCVDLSDLMRRQGKDLPLNSETQKLFFSKIDNLAENFVHLDDDWFFGRDVACSDFFTAEGTPIQPSHDHAPTAWTKKLYDDAVRALPQDIRSIVERGDTSRFDPMPNMQRYLQDINMVSVSEAINPGIWLRDMNVHQYFDVLKSIVEIRPKCYCVNDDWSADSEIYAEQMRSLQAFFEEMYPNPGVWEKSG